MKSAVTNTAGDRWPPEDLGHFPYPGFTIRSCTAARTPASTSRRRAGQFPRHSQTSLL